MKHNYHVLRPDDRSIIHDLAEYFAGKDDVFWRLARRLAKAMGVNIVVTSGDLAFHYHSSGHTAVPADWQAFLDFADRHFKASATK